MRDKALVGNDHPLGRLPVNKSLPQTIAAVAMSVVALCWVTFVFSSALTRHEVAGRDYIQYWAAGKQLIHGADPYEAKAIFRLEKSAGLTRLQPEISFSPPLILPFVLLFGLFSAKTGLTVLFAVLLAAISISMWILWQIQGSPNTLLFLLGFLFAPLIVCLQAGQISILLLFGIMLFLYFVESRSWLAGIALFPLTLKPHLFLPFAVALLLWVFSRRAYGLLAGFFSVLGVGLVLTFLVDPHAWAQYRHMMEMQGALSQPLPTLSQILQRSINRDALWLQFVPEVVACAWAVWYFRKHQSQWKWMDQGLLLLLVSSVCRPYGWFFDESVLLPAVLTGVLLARQTGRSLWPIAVAGAVALVEGFQRVPVTSMAYVWTAPAWLMWYLYASGRCKSRLWVKMVPHPTSVS
ncbi:MAG: glycosyltransferase family 87 protein [Acidithiobacillus sp.]|nr:glycosyltransferase family 87 protein [Acidithiobacillus sp.]